MENGDPSQKEPQDSTRKAVSELVQEIKETNTSSEAAQKMQEEQKIIIDEETQKKISENEMIQEALDQKSASIIKLSNELESILSSINTTWENYPEGYAKYFTEEIKPKFQELLNYPCITSYREKVLLIFGFICKYFLSRINYLKVIPKEEMYLMITTIYGGNMNIFSTNPNLGGNQAFELIDDAYFYHIFKEILPNKDIENSYCLNNKNCLYKYFLEFIFQSGFVENYLNVFLFRDDIAQSEFGNLLYFPANLLYLCDMDFIKKKNWNITIIKIINSKINYFLSEQNPNLKDDNAMYYLVSTLSNFYLDSALGLFNHIFEDLISNYISDCQNIAVMVFRINECFLKNQKINFRMIGIQNINNLCDNYVKFLNRTGNYIDYMKKYDHADKIYEFLIKMGIEYLAKMNIFNIIFGENIHEGVIQRSYFILSLLYKTKVFNSSHIQILWNLSQTKYQSISNAIISLFGKLLPEFSIEDCKSILTIVDKMQFKEVNDITLKLLENFFHGNIRHELLLNILFKFSNELSYERGLDRNIILKSRAILVRLLMNKNYIQDLFKFIKRSIFHIHKFYLFDTHYITLSQILDFLADPKNNQIYNNFTFESELKNFNMLINYLDDKFKLFPVLMNHIIKVIKLYAFFYTASTKIIDELNKGNFDYDILLNIDTLYSEYVVFNESNINFSYSLDNNNINEIKENTDMDLSNGNKNNKKKGNFILESEFNNEIKDNEQQMYIKKLIKDYTIFFKGTISSTNTLPSEMELKYIIFHKLKIDFPNITYDQLINSIIRTLFVNILHSESNFKPEYISFLYNIAQTTNNIDNSLSWYYNLIYDIFNTRINQNHNNIIDDKVMQNIINVYIKNGNYESMPISSFNTVLLFITYVNQKINNAVFSPIIQKFTEIQSFKSFKGFDIIWQFYLYTKNDSVLDSAFNVLINIFELCSKKEEDRNNLINQIFDFISKNKNNIMNDPKIKLSFIRILKVISVILGTKINKDIFENNNNNSNSPTIKVICKNHYFSTNNNVDIIININKEQKIKNLKEYIIEAVICTEENLVLYNKKVKEYNDNILNQRNNINTNSIQEEEKMNLDTPELKYTLTMEQFKKEVYATNILINYKNTVLKDEFTVADYKIEENSRLFIFKGNGNYEEEYVPSESELQEGYIGIKSIFGDNLYFGEDVMKASIIKHKGNIEDAGLYLTVPANVEILQKEIEEKKSRLEQKGDDIICLDEGKINLLIDVLNSSNDGELTAQIWELFSSIKYPDNFINIIIGEQLENILTINDTNKLILFLEIINSLIFNGEFCKYNKLSNEQKNMWISNFIRNEQLIKKIIGLLNNLNTNMDAYHLYTILKIFIGWLHKILFNICEVLSKMNENFVNILPEIKMLRTLNTHDNNGNNVVADKDKFNDELKIINAQDGLNFLKIISEENGILIFYKLINLIIKLSSMEVKKDLLQKISEFIIMGLMLQKNDIKKFCAVEKKNILIIQSIFFSQFEIERKMLKNFLKVLIRNLMPLTDQSALETGNDIFTIIFEIFISKLLSGLYFNNEICDIFSFLLVFSTNNYILKIIEPFIYKILDEIYNFCSNLDKINEVDISNLRYNSYVINGCLKYYSNIIINYINNINKAKKIDYIEFLYNFLFAIEKNKKDGKINSYKFKYNMVRDKLLNLLTELISLDNNYLMQILPNVILHHKKLEKVDPNKIETPFDVNIRSPSEKLIGLRNFGSTCYLNSLTQQLFMMPSFRKDLFNNFIIANNINDKNEQEKLRYSVIYNLQLTFENLKNGGMSPYPPKRFIRSFLSAFNGEPIQFGIQQDSDEFLSILCDNLEKEAKAFNKEYFLENSFKGKISNEILSLEKEYPYYSQSEEPFFRITLDIKGHKSLEEALDAYVKGEILDGDNKYYVEEHKRKISIRKSSSLKMLGNIVIIHLKRFEFDFVTFSNHKLSDYLKFPRQINFKKWTRAYLRLNDNQNNKLSEDLLKITDAEKQNLIDDNMDYILTGILVHGGSNLQSGHYYSYIMDQETGEWHQFNDNTISDYNIDTELEKECFGNMGENNVNQYGRTAYLLFYTKKSVFKNKNLLENININQAVLNDVYNENVKFLNMNIFLNDNYFNFLQKYCEQGLQLLNDENQTNKVNNLTVNNYLIRNNYIYQKVMSVLRPDNDDDSVDENMNTNNQEKAVVNLPNFEQVYNKCKEEIDIVLSKEKEENKKINNFISRKKLIKLYFNYTFGIIYPYYKSQNTYNKAQNQELLMKVFKALLEIIKNNSGYSLWILKQMEKNISLFIDFMFRFGTTENELSDMAKLILEFFQITFDIIYNFEKENMDMVNDILQYFIKNDQGKWVIVKEYRSIIMRLMKKLFCDNLEKSRYEYAQSSLFLTIFYNMVKNYPEVASITVNYYFILVSLISNNTLTTIKSEQNPNFFMGNNSGYIPNFYYMLIFCDTLLRCVTPGMKLTSTYSPYFLNRKKNLEYENIPDWSYYPSLPQNWDKILTTEFYVHFMLYHNYSKWKEITCHLCYCDEEVSVKIMKLVCEFIKSKTFMPMVEKVFNNALYVFDLKDNLEHIRVDALFELNDKINQEPVELEQHKILCQYLEDEKENSIKFVLLMLYCFGKAIENYDVIAQYFDNNKNKLGWIGTFIFKIKNDQITKDKFIKECGYILNQHPDLLQVIQDNLIKRFIQK